MAEVEVEFWAYKPLKHEHESNARRIQGSNIGKDDVGREEQATRWTKER